MIYKIGMLCKHFKGNSLLEKNIYKIEKIGIDGSQIDENKIIYTGDGILFDAKNLVIYSNIFQENSLFTREYEDISSNLTIEKQRLYKQKIKVQPLTKDEIIIVNSEKFIKEKREYNLHKFKDK